MVKGEELAVLGLTRDWRCMREDGSYGGPCFPPDFVLPVDYPKYYLNYPHRHELCGWQWSIMERDLDST